jgi:4'-phosphopantetheinyl transferase
VGPSSGVRVWHLGGRLPARVEGASLAEVGLWLAAPEAAHGEAERWLSEAERGRLAAMQHPRAREEFLTGRWLLRGVLGRLLDCHPREVPLAIGPHGAIGLDDRATARARLGLNLSHTPGCVALAVAPGRAVGVDVEWTQRPGRTVELAQRYFAPAELAELAELASEAQRTRFFALWTLKEAYIKALGLGLQVPLRRFAFHFRGDAPRLEDPEAGEMRAWRCRTDALGPAHRVGLVWEGLALQPPRP